MFCLRQPGGIGFKRSDEAICLQDHGAQIKQHGAQLVHGALGQLFDLAQLGLDFFRRSLAEFTHKFQIHRDRCYKLCGTVVQVSCQLLPDILFDGYQPVALLSHFSIQLCVANCDRRLGGKGQEE